MSLVLAAADPGSQTVPSSRVAPVDAPSLTDPRYRRWLAIALLAWVALTILVLPFGIGGSWRECDTQAIARNFLLDGFDPLRPRVDWRGVTDGAVECEFPLYQTMIASVMAVLGEAEWPGRVISTLAMVMASLSLFRLLERRTGGEAAFFGTLVFLTGGHAFLLGTRVTPDATSTACAIAGLAAFVQFLDTGRTRTLALATVMTAVACLTKPTALQIGLLQFLWTLGTAPRRLRDVRVWIAWAAVLAVVGAWIVQGTRLYAETGLTFGVVAGGETKFPSLWAMRDKWTWIWLFVTTIRYGFSVFGCLGLFTLLVRGRIDRRDWLLLGVVGLGLVGTLRYSHHYGIGPQYHVFAAMAGAWFFARSWPLLTAPGVRPLLVAGLAVAAGYSVYEELADKPLSPRSVRRTNSPWCTAIASASMRSGSGAPTSKSPSCSTRRADAAGCCRRTASPSTSSRACTSRARASSSINCPRRRRPMPRPGSMPTRSR